MLQQTQVQTVIPYFDRFMHSYPSLAALSHASEDEVLAHWSGLGYYRRAKLLHKAAQTIFQEHDGEFPETLSELLSLPGIGRSTAGAILAGGFDRRGVVLDGNVKRVLARFHAIEGPVNQSSVEKRLWALADEHTPAFDCANYVQAVMDLGATCCTRHEPKCESCPLKQRCLAYETDRVHQLPERATRGKSRKESIRFMLFVDEENRFLLQKQPSHGVWSSLWLPLICDTEKTTQEALEEIGYEESKFQEIGALKPFNHVLTHIRFDVGASVIRLLDVGERTKDSSKFRWYKMACEPTIAVASITNKLLEMGLNKLEAEPTVNR